MLHDNNQDTQFAKNPVRKSQVVASSLVSSFP